jgi:LysM repeat protein
MKINPNVYGVFERKTEKLICLDDSPQIHILQLDGNAMKCISKVPVNRLDEYASLNSINIAMS